MKSRVAVTQRVTEREQEVNKHPKAYKFILGRPAACVAQCERAGHLGSAGDDTRRRIKRKSKQNSKEQLEQQTIKIREKIIR